MPFWSFLSNFMSRFFSSLAKGKGSDSGAGAKEAGFQKAKTGGLMSKATVLVNATDHTLFLRDKVGAAYGTTRYKILGQSRIEVTPLQHTFFKMIAYAVEEEQPGEGKDEADGASETAGAVGSSKKKMSTDTRLTIDSDQLADNKEIKITHNGSKYEIQLIPR